MAKIFSLDTRKGTFLDSVSNTELTNSGVVLKRMSKGVTGKFDSVDGYLTKTALGKTYDSIIIEFNIPFTVDATTSALGLGTVFGSLENNGIISMGNISGGIADEVMTVWSSSGVGAYIDTVIPAGPHQLILYWNGTDYSWEFDNVPVVHKNFLSGLSSKLQGNISIGKREGQNQGYLYLSNRVVLFDHSLKAAERLSYYNDFVNSHPMAENKRPVYPKPTSLSGDGLVFASNMIPRGNTLPDISGNGNDGIIIDCPPTNDGMRGLGNNSNSEVYFTAPILNNETVWTVAVKIKDYTKGASFDIFAGGELKKNLYFLSSDHVGFRSNFATHYRWDGSGNTVAVPSTDIENKDIDLVFRSDGTDIHLSVNGVSKGYVTPDDTTIFIDHLVNGFDDRTDNTPKFTFEYTEIHSTFKNEKYAKGFHNLFAKQVYFKDTFEFEHADGTRIHPYGWNVGTGEFKGVALPKKGIECTVGGTIAFQSSQAFGVWEFSFIQNTDTNRAYYIIAEDISGVVNSYGFNVLTGRKLRMVRTGAATLFLTANNYIDLGIKYTIRIYRTFTGEFSVFIKGGAFLDFTLVSTTGGQGSNPIIDNTITSSNMVVVSLSAGQGIDYFKINKGIEV